jgi:hypothetical protein
LVICRVRASPPSRRHTSNEPRELPSADMRGRSPPVERRYRQRRR